MPSDWAGGHGVSGAFNPVLTRAAGKAPTLLKAIPVAAMRPNTSLASRSPWCGATSATTSSKRETLPCEGATTLTAMLRSSLPGSAKPSWPSVHGWRSKRVGLPGPKLGHEAVAMALEPRTAPALISAGWPRSGGGLGAVSRRLSHRGVTCHTRHAEGCRSLSTPDAQTA